ncbi:hypothetical protein EDB81DRAFT_758438 [Dactylonectria macrodidyma]|uniref:Uncharacterized protein n=1 Tax=Dactylonectria macrodidyma TaxID=307937 RepID=A0A9P9JDY5_9HYPO|nr:hypothetical protein EDB81DRAFT_758438 [Dactylonectria macrodidyma]
MVPAVKKCVSHIMGHFTEPPAPPSIEEQQYYYYGLPSKSKLVARSSSDPWAFRDNWSTPTADTKEVEAKRKAKMPIEKALGVVGPHIIADLWNVSTGPLRIEILQALSGVKWTAIDILRIGYVKIPNSDEKPEQPITLLISVEPDSISWSQGYEVVMQCRQILQRHGINDVHWVSIAPFDQPDRQGTKCIYLRQKITGDVFALTCRHVLFDKSSPNEEYRYNNLDPRTVIQPCNESFNKAKSDVAGFVDKFTLREGWEEWTPSYFSSEDAKLHETRMQAKLRPYEQLLQHMENLDDPASRIIGHVIFSPKFGTCTTASGSRRLRDWALIELHPGKHRSHLEDLENRVIIGDCGTKPIVSAMRESMGPDTKSRLCYSEKSHTVRLQGKLSELEMMCPRTLTGEHGPATMVAKHGSKSGLTVGFTNNVQSVIRHPYDDDITSDELCIVGHRPREGRLTSFSGAGDS